MQGTADRTARRATALPIVSVLVALSAPGQAAPKEREAQRAVWVGLSGGALAGARAEALESQLVESIQGRDSFRIVDASGAPLDERLFAPDLARMTKLFDEGIDLLLNLKAKRAVPKFEEAIELFNARLAARPNHDPLHDALLAKAEALFQLGRMTSAADALRTLAALSPVREPTKKTHPPKFVALWEKARAEVGTPGHLVVASTPEGASVWVDGRLINASASTPAQLPPGRHLVTVRWPFFAQTELVTLDPGRTTELAVSPAGPGATARRALLEVVEAKRGVEDARPAVARIADLARASEVWLAAVRMHQGRESLLIARHEASGALRAVVRVPLEADPAMLPWSRVLAALLDEPAGERQVDGDGAERAEGLAESIYSGTEAVAAKESPVEAPLPAVSARAPKDEDRASEPRVRVPSAPLTLPPPGPEPEEHGITKTWWFWTTIGVAVLGAAAVAGGLALRPDPRSSRLEVIFDEDGP